MKLRQAAFFGAFSATAIALVIACSDGSEDVTVPAGDDDDASRPVPGEGAIDAAGDDGDAASIDAAIARTCSKGGFCHTVLPAEQTLTGIWGDGTGVVWAVSEQGNVLRWDGQAWSTHATGKGTLHAIWGSSATDIWIAGAEGLFHSTGASSASLAWTAVPVGGDPSVPLLSLWGASATDVWAAGGSESYDQGTPRAARVLHYDGAQTDGGPLWRLDPISDTGVTIQKVWGSSSADVWLGGSSGTANWFDRHAEVFRRSSDGDGGLSWTQVDRPEITLGGSYGGLTGGAAFSDGAWWVLERTNLDRSCAWRASSADAASPIVWTSTCVVDPAPILRAIWRTGAGDTWVAGDDGFLLRWTGKSLAQAQITVDDHPVTRSLLALWGQGSDELWVAGENIALHRANKPDGAKP